MGTSVSLFATDGGCCGDASPAVVAPRSDESPATRQWDASLVQMRLLAARRSLHASAMSGACPPQQASTPARQNDRDVRGDTEHSLRSWGDDSVDGAPNPLLYAQPSSSVVTSGGATLIPTAAASVTAGSSLCDASNSHDARMNANSDACRDKAKIDREGGVSGEGTCVGAQLDAMQESQRESTRLDAATLTGEAALPVDILERTTHGQSGTAQRRVATLAEVGGYGAPLRCIVPVASQSHVARRDDDADQMLDDDDVDLGACHHGQDKSDGCYVAVVGPVGQSPRPRVARHRSSHEGAAGGADPSSPLNYSTEGSVATTMSEHQSSSHRFGGAVDSLGLYRSCGEGGSSMSLDEAITPEGGRGIEAAVGSPATLDGSFF